MEFAALSAKAEVLEWLDDYIRQHGFTVESSDFNRPWGGFFVLEEGDADRFIEKYFPGYTKEQLMIGENSAPNFCWLPRISG
jgi:mannose-6-phosphate isomerase